MLLAAAPALGPAWLNPDTILSTLGPWALWGAAAIVFAECGLLIGFFLPGDSLLFTVGLLAGSQQLGHPLWLACVVLTVMAFVGNVVGYEIGRWTGPAIFRNKDSRIFKQAYVDKTVAFFDKYGTRAIILARFVPIVRTFITVTAGVGQMDRRRYLTYSGIGGAAWASGVTILGAMLGQFEFVKNNLEAMLLSIVLVSVMPIVVEFLRERAKSRREAPGPKSGEPTTAGTVPSGAVPSGAVPSGAVPPGTFTPSPGSGPRPSGRHVS